MKYLFTIIFFVILCVPANAARYCAELGDGDIVQRVIVCNGLDWPSQNLGGRWVETYMDRADRNYAGQGYHYDATKGNFSSPQPYPSWTLDENVNWQPPVPRPTDGKFYLWDESTLSWRER